MIQNTSCNFALIGAGGYIAPRHLKAIKDTGNKLVAAVDPKDSVGILDGYFFDAEFFTEFERYESFAENLRKQGDAHKIQYVSICTPNYLHEHHMLSALRLGANVICEKPLVLNTAGLDRIIGYEKTYAEGKINTVLQLRLHPAIQELKAKVDADTSGSIYDVDLTYITPRGKWYFESWKGYEYKSGGLALNIGIHFFDMLIWIFGSVKNVVVHKSTPSMMSGRLDLAKASIRWYLSLDQADLPEENKAQNKAFRSLSLNGEEFAFSEGFTDLHTEVYKKVLEGKGFTPEDVRSAIECVETMRTAPFVEADIDSKHPYLVDSFDRH